MKKILMITMFAAMFCGCGNGQGYRAVKTVGADEFAGIMARNDVRLVDVRTPEEYAAGHLAGAENIDVKAANFAKRIKGIEGEVAVYCRGGRRSLTAAQQLAANGCTVYNLDGGILAWQKAGKTTTTMETDIFATHMDYGLVKIHALTHASICIEYDGRTIYVDPVTQLRGRTVDYSVLPKADIILVTHEHFDHYDTAAIRLLTTDKTRLIMNPRCVELYGSGTAMKNGDKRRLAEGITLVAVPAYNTTEGHLQFHPKGRDNGYILNIGSLRLYIAGDTEDIPEMADLKDIDIDIAFLPCNQPYTMTPEQLVRAAKIIKPKVLFPYHYSETDVSGIPVQLPGIDVRIRHYE
ncbi:MAG: MBL fold metallo-hydrolase [Bacteroidales bacterium]|nr:MBL fold metallo-hydrolase [Bacteroidales bacterium]